MFDIHFHVRNDYHSKSKFYLRANNDNWLSTTCKISWISNWKSHCIDLAIRICSSNDLSTDFSSLYKIDLFLVEIRRMKHKFNSFLGLILSIYWIVLPIDYLVWNIITNKTAKFTWWIFSNGLRFSKLYECLN